MKVGVAWYAEAEWETLRQVAADPEALEATYADWLTLAEKTLGDLVAAGVVAERVHVQVAELQEWCKREGRRLDGTARSDFAAELLRRRHQGLDRLRGA